MKPCTDLTKPRWTRAGLIVEAALHGPLYLLDSPVLETVTVGGFPVAGRELTPNKVALHRSKGLQAVAERGSFPGAPEPPRRSSRAGTR